MAIFFAGSELLEIAIGIEKNGMAFYQALAHTVKKASPDDKLYYTITHEFGRLKVGSCHLTA